MQIIQKLDGMISSKTIESDIMMKIPRLVATLAKAIKFPENCKPW